MQIGSAIMKTTERMSVVLADTYALYLKTQNYHWHMRGKEFYALHLLLEKQYKELAEAIDTIAERIVISGAHAPAGFKTLSALTHIKDGHALYSADEMLKDLVSDHEHLVEELYKALKQADADGDEGNGALISERIAAHQKMRWMLSASI